LQEVVELRSAGVQSLCLGISDFLLTDVNLEANDISVLNFALREGRPRLHELDHASFDFLIKLQRRRRWPSHLLANQTVEISDLLVLANKDFALTEQRLAADVEPLQENHDRGVLRVGVCSGEFGGIRVMVEVQSEVVSAGGHVGADVVHGLVSVMILAVRYRCCSSFSLLLASICSLS
jgi:hypothetical protein